MKQQLPEHLDPEQLAPELLISDWQDWGKLLSRKPVLLSPLAEGLTNQSFLLDSDIGRLVLRINHPNSESLGINRQRELLILEALNKLHGPEIAPEVIYSCTDYRYLVYRFIEGRVWTATDASKPDNQQKLKSLIERYQKIDLPIEPRNYKNHLRHYWQQLTEKELVDQTLKKEWLDFLPKLNETNWTACLSHHDLIPENIIETADGLKIIDWEYAHLGHPGLDWVSINGIKEQEYSLAPELLYWMNRLWTLLANAR